MALVASKIYGIDRAERVVVLKKGLLPIQGASSLNFDILNGNCLTYQSSA